MPVLEFGENGADIAADNIARALQEDEDGALQHADEDTPRALQNNELQNNERSPPPSNEGMTAMTVTPPAEEQERRVPAPVVKRRVKLGKLKHMP